MSTAGHEKHFFPWVFSSTTTNYVYVVKLILTGIQLTVILKIVFVIYRFHKSHTAGEKCNLFSDVMHHVVSWWLLEKLHEFLDVCCLQ